MAFAVLDLATLFVITAAAIGFSGIVLVLVLARDRGRSSVALMIWGVAMVIGASGIVCLASTHAKGPRAEDAGDALIIFGTGLSWTAARIFDGRRPKPAFVLAGPAICLVWLIVPLPPDVLLRPILVLLLGSTYTLATAVEFWRGRAEQLQSRMPVVVLLYFHAGVYLCRALDLYLVPQDGWPHESDIVAALMIEALLHTIAIAFLLLALTKERAELLSTIRLRELAWRDELTGLGNRRAFDTTLESEFRKAARDGTPLGLLMIDVDDFKSFNDLYGHQCGDECLRAIAFAIRTAAHGAGDVGIRYGGDECAMLLPGTDLERAASVARSVLTNVEALGIEHAGSPHGRVAVSIGVAAASPGQGEIPHALVQAADVALYGAKTAGRNRMRVASR